MVEKAYAKVNLSLDVIGKREDGFHNLRSIMHSVTLFDELKIDITPSEESEITVCSNIPHLNNSDNLISRAAEIFMRRSGVHGKIFIKLEKNIPIGAGLGGGSSDAAAMLRALNGHYGSFSAEEMLQICAEVGSDVSFCYYGKTALCEGRGEILTPIAFERKLFFVIAIGNERISTPKAYGALDEKFSDFDGSVERCGYDNAPKLFYGADNKEAVEIYNIFEEIFRDEAGDVFDLKALLTEFGAKYTLMTGSGPAVFGIFDTPSEALAARKKIISLGFDAFYAESVF